MEKKWQNRIESKFIYHIINPSFRTFGILAKNIFLIHVYPFISKISLQN